LVGDVKAGREALMSMISNNVDSSVYEQDEEEQEEAKEANDEDMVDDVTEERPKKKTKTVSIPN
jgi:hypothetical protein